MKSVQHFFCPYSHIITSRRIFSVAKGIINLAYNFFQHIRTYPTTRVFAFLNQDINNPRLSRSIQL